MYIIDQYKLYRIAHTLLTEYNYELLHIDYNKNIVWLEKYEKGTSYLFRLNQQGFDWRNHLAEDIQKTVQEVEKNRQLTRSKRVEFYNVYVSAHSPVDDWSDLKQPQSLRDRQSIQMHLFYFDRQNFHEEYQRFNELTAIEMGWVYDVPSEIYAEQFVHAYKRKLIQEERKKKERIRQIFSFGKPRLTYILIAINVLIFLVLESSGSSTDIEHLIDYGAKYNPAIIDGEWWRIVTSMFLHIGMFHLFMNMLALYYLGTAVERIFGTPRFFLIYFFGGLIGGFASFAFTINVSAGASGAIFGLFGALLYFGLIHKQLFFQTMGRNLLFIVGLNIVFGFIVPQIDNGAHLGGLLGGFLVTAIVNLPNTSRSLKQLGALIGYVVIVIGLIGFGIHSHENNSFFELHKVEQMLAAGEYEQAIEHSTEQIENSDSDLLAQFLFQRGYAYIQLGNIYTAIDDLEQCIQLTDEIPEAYYNLSLLYYDLGDIETAIERITEAVELDPTNKDFRTIYDKLLKE